MDPVRSCGLNCAIRFNESPVQNVCRTTYTKLLKDLPLSVVINISFEFVSSPIRWQSQRTVKVWPWSTASYGTQFAWGEQDHTHLLKCKWEKYPFRLPSCRMSIKASVSVIRHLKWTRLCCVLPQGKRSPLSNKHYICILLQLIQC